MILRLVILKLSFINFVLSQRCGESASSQNGLKLEVAYYSVSKVTGVGDCTMKCYNDPQCQSYNMRMSSLECMLLSTSHAYEDNKLKQTDDDWVYMVNILHPHFTDKCKNGGIAIKSSTSENIACDCSKTKFTGKICDELHPNCKSLHRGSPTLPSGYYHLNVSGMENIIYCDMELKGGGWSLVSSIAGSNKNHLSTSALCYNSSTCVYHQGTSPSTITAQKRSDKDIRELAIEEGLFRVDVISTTSYTVFFKIPSGAKLFSSTCTGSACPRIISSHSYPYSWESSPCTGVEKGYNIHSSCYYVFDNHDNGECGSMWSTSKYTTERVLYGYCLANGIYSGLAGYMYVK